MRETYSTMFDESLLPRDVRLRIVNAAWSEGYGKFESETIKHQETGISDIDLRLGKPRHSTALMSVR
jgi:hypothetical protein